MRVVSPMRPSSIALLAERLLLDFELVTTCARLGSDLARRTHVWVFAYGSLLWNPAFEAAEQVVAVLPGWHRAFCIRLTRFRGTPQQPGLMMSLVPGGSCRGALVRISGNGVLDSLRKL